RVKANVERLAAAAGDRAKQLSAAERARLNAVLDKLDSELSAITDLVLQHPDVRRLELAWRGLKFLVDRFDFREGVRLAVLDAPREEAVARFSAEVINPAFDGEIRTPGLVLFDYPITNTPADIALLDDLGQHAASLPVPAVFPLETAFFNVKDIKLIKNLPNLSGFVDGWQFAKWRSLRDKPYTRMLVPVLGRFLLRAPYAVTAESREFVASETVTAERELAWGGGHLALAVCAARSYARYGWPTRMFGAEAGKLEDLPVVPSSKDADKTWGPGDAFLPDRRLDEFAAIGINLLQSVKNNDYCILLGGVSLARPIARGEADKQQALLEISLPYQQFSNILSAYLCDVQPGLRGLAAEELQRRLIYGLRNLIGLTDKDAEDAVMVGTGPAPDDASQTLVQVRITPPGRIVPGGLCIDLGFTV
ncbi:MAG: type VI secretion system contractile sheath large subunit, partial [Planctomycetes bacterium]|nr:type VI secretion system contractile sheath large subunit [Planctomycetota bacterium]